MGVRVLNCVHLPCVVKTGIGSETRDNIYGLTISILFCHGKQSTQLTF